jgi:hypothetical protein
MDGGARCSRTHLIDSIIVQIRGIRIPHMLRRESLRELYLCKRDCITRIKHEVIYKNMQDSLVTIVEVINIVDVNCCVFDG